MAVAKTHLEEELGSSSRISGKAGQVSKRLITPEINVRAHLVLLTVPCCPRTIPLDPQAAPKMMKECK